MNRECFTPAPPAEAVQDKNRNSRLLFQLLAFTHLFQHTVRIHPKFVFKAWLNMANMPIYFWCKSFRADNPSFQYNIKMPVLPFTYNKKYTIQPQDFFFTCVNTRGGAVLGNTDSKRKTVADFFFSPQKISAANFKKGYLGSTLLARRPHRNLAVRTVTICLILRQSKPHSSIYWLTGMLVPFQFNSQLSFEIAEIAKKRLSS